MILKAFAILLALQQPTQTATVRPDTAALLSRVVAEEQLFLNAWHRAWVRSEGTRHPISENVRNREHIRGRDTLAQHVTRSWDTAFYGPRNQVQSRIANGRCALRDTLWWKLVSYMHGTWREGTVPTQAIGPGWSIKSRETSFGVCPSWYIGPGDAPPWDERTDIDGPLTDAERPSIAALRVHLIQALDSAARAMPQNNWVAGQRVRFLVDAHAFEEAVDAARSCQADPFWCELLLGYAYAGAGDLRSAERAFIDAIPKAAAGARCTWMRVSELLEPPERDAYERKNCAGQDTVNRNLWWLADPLWSEPGNDRLVEHYARRVLLLLRTGMPRDERFLWAAGSGADARAEMIVRYGWPSFVYWKGFSLDSIHTEDLAVSRWDRNAPASPPNEPYTTYEYARGRLHLVPASKAVFAPLSAASTDWSLASPAGGDSVPWYPWREFPNVIMTNVEGGRIGNERTAIEWHWVLEDYPNYVRDVLWWPVEHYAGVRPLAELTGGRTAILRRDSWGMYASAVRVPEARGASAMGIPGRAVLLQTSSPDSISTIVSTSIPADTAMPIVLFGAIPAGRSLVGREVVPADSTAPAWRTRGSVEVVPLDSMPKGEIAASDAIVLRVPPGTDTLPARTDAALALMAASDTVRRGMKIGLYWEVYGVDANEEARFTISVVKAGSPGLMRRLLSHLSLTSDGHVALSVSWTDARAGAGAYVIPGRVPALGRSILLDVSRLTPGDYWMDIEVSAGGRNVSTGRRMITVR